jgi:hypothetical protein
MSIDTTTLVDFRESFDKESDHIGQPCDLAGRGSLPHFYPNIQSYGEGPETAFAAFAVSLLPHDSRLFTARH